ncbi:MAG: ChaN family lipoprotein [Cryomorphaceae bacterium]|nr:ChaN family lipoprotein [Cryomorphaceae bacterium]
MRKLALALFLLGNTLLSPAQSLPENTVLYDKNGEKITIEEMITKLLEAQVVLFGELHGLEATHIMEQIIANELFKKVGDKLILGGEMWERDQQLIVDEYVRGLITLKQFKGDARLWPNFEKDYLAFINIAKENNLPFIATNVPRRYASVLFHEGVEALDKFSKEAKSLMPKLPFTFDPALPLYADMEEQMAGHGHDSKHLSHSQALKDATMAYWIVNNMKKKNLFFHINGEFHSKEFQGIYNYIRQEKKKWKVMSISSVMQIDVHALEDDNIMRADFIFVIPAPEEVKMQEELAEDDEVTITVPDEKEDQKEEKEIKQ